MRFAHSERTPFSRTSLAFEKPSGAQRGGVSAKGAMVALRAQRWAEPNARTSLGEGAVAHKETFYMVGLAKIFFCRLQIGVEDINLITYVGTLYQKLCALRAPGRGPITALRPRASGLSERATVVKPPAASYFSASQSEATIAMFGLGGAQASQSEAN
jgi:hypothetical protein